MAFKAIFLDRDDTIIDDPGYISEPDQVVLLPGSAQALRNMRKLGYKLIVVSNQSAVARGMVTEDGLKQIHQRLERLLADHDVYLDGIYYCPYHPEGVVAEYRKESELRKPNPGMLIKAAEEMDVDLKSSWMIGDSYRDVEAGRKVGCNTILINSPAKPKHKKPEDPTPDFIAVNIKESANIIRMHDSKIKRNSQAEGFKTERIKESDSIPDSQATNSNLKQESSTTENSDKKVDRGEKPEKNVIKNKVYSSKDRNVAFKDTSKTLNEEYPTQTKLLREILNHLKEGSRENLYHDFSVAKLFAAIIQVVAIFCLLLSVWLMMDSSKSELSMFKPLGFAIVLQLMCLTLYIMDEIK